jgi:hypothetical protein
MLESNEAPFRRAVAARAECAVEIKEYDGSGPMGGGDGHPFSGEQEAAADGLGFPAPENAPLPLVLDERLQETMTCIESEHERFRDDRLRGIRRVPVDSVPEYYSRSPLALLAVKSGEESRTVDIVATIRRTDRA